MILLSCHDVKTRYTYYVMSVWVCQQSRGGIWGQTSRTRFFAKFHLVFVTVSSIKIRLVVGAFCAVLDSGSIHLSIKSVR